MKASNMLGALQCWRLLFTLIILHTATSTCNCMKFEETSVIRNIFVMARLVGKEVKRFAPIFVANVQFSVIKTHLFENVSYSSMTTSLR